MEVCIIQYNAGNSTSVAHALERLQVPYRCSSDPSVIAAADKVIFPGVGEAQTTMNYLKAKQLDKVIPELKQPVLGICLGMQLLCEYSEERNTKCLGVLEVNAERFKPEVSDKIPHIGWNTLQEGKDWCLAFNHLYFYFVHSYFVPVNPFTVGITDYGVPFSAAVRKNNFYGVQFHPEKSGDIGSRVLENFLKV
jgi:glutamine amidotransferase